MFVVEFKAEVLTKLQKFELEIHTNYSTYISRDLKFNTKFIKSFLTLNLKKMPTRKDIEVVNLSIFTVLTSDAGGDRNKKVCYTVYTILDVFSPKIMVKFFLLKWCYGIIIISINC